MKFRVPEISPSVQVAYSICATSFGLSQRRSFIFSAVNPCNYTFESMGSQRVDEHRRSDFGHEAIAEVRGVVQLIAHVVPDDDRVEIAAGRNLSADHSLDMRNPTRPGGASS
jgi:hypothetical protein